jgi:hypothetical protein
MPRRHDSQSAEKNQWLRASGGQAAPGPLSGGLFAYKKTVFSIE